MIELSPFAAPPEERQVTSLLGIFSTMIEGHQAVYLSAPITSGLRHLRWHRLIPGDGGHREGDPQMDHDDQVVKPNIAAALREAHELRMRHGFLVIVPSHFVKEGWTQANYRFFWGLVLERFVGRVYFMHGWEFSLGCSYEFLVTSKLQRPAYCQDGTLLTTQAGIKALERASKAMEMWGLSPELQRTVVAQLAPTTVPER